MIISASTSSAQKLNEPTWAVYKYFNPPCSVNNGNCLIRAITCQKLKKSQSCIEFFKIGGCIC